MAVLLGALRYYRIRYWNEFSDESDNIVAGWLIHRGRTLYDSLFSHHMPLGYMWAHLVSAVIPDATFATYRSIPFLFELGAALSFGFSPGLKRKSLGWIAGGFFILLTCISSPLWLGHELLVENLWGSCFVIFFNLLVFPVLLKNERHLNQKVCFWGGVALAFWVSGTLITFYPALISLAYFLFYRKQLGRRLIPILTGVAAGGAIQVLWLSFYGSWSGFLQEAILFNLQVYSKYTVTSPSSNTGPLAAILQLSRNLMSLLSQVWGNTNPIHRLMLISAGLFSGIWFWRVSLWSGLLLLAWLVSLMARGTTGFHALPYFLFGLTLMSWFMVGVPNWTKAKWQRPATSILFLIVVLFSWIRFVPDYLGWKANYDSSQFIPHLQPEVEYIRNHSQPNGRISVFTIHPILYFATRREPAQSSIFYLPWVAAWEKSKGDLRTCRELESSRPSLVWMDEETVWGAYRWEDFGDCLNRFVRQNYRKVDAKKFPYLYESLSNGESSSDHPSSLKRGLNAQRN